MNASTRGAITEHDQAIAASVGDIFQRVHALLEKRDFDHQDNARVNSLLRLAELKLPSGKAALRNIEVAALEQRHGLDEATYRRAFNSFLKFWFSQISAEERATLQHRFQRIEGFPEIRAQAAGAGGAGGYAVPQDFASELSLALKGASSMRRVSSIVETERGNPLPWPTSDDTSNVGELLAENIAAASQDVTFGQIVFSAYKYSSKLILCSTEFVTDAMANIQTHLTRIAGRRLGRITNTHFTTGDNTGKPQGVVPAATLGKTGLAGQLTSVIAADLTDLLHSVDIAYRPGSTWMMKDSTFKSIRALNDLLTTAPILFMPRQPGEPPMLHGYPVEVNDDIPAMAAGQRSVLFGNFQLAYQIRDSLSEIALVRLSERYAPSSQVGFIMFIRTDGRVLDINAVKAFQHAAS